MVDGRFEGRVFKRVQRIKGCYVGLGLLIFFLCCSWAYAQQDKVSVAFHDTAQIEGKHILLSEIAEVAGPDSALVSKLKAIRIGNAPPLGISKKVKRFFCRQRIEQEGIGLSSVSFSGPETVTVQLAAVAITASDIKEATYAFIKKETSYAPEDIILEFKHVSEEVLIPKGHSSVELRPLNNGPLKGNTLIYLAVMVDGTIYRKLPVSLKIRVFERVVVAGRRLERNLILTEEDVYLKRLETTLLRHDVITNVEQVIGKATRQIINTGKVIYRDRIDVPPIIKRGELITLVAQFGNVRVTALGKAKEDGRAGDRIAVINVDSRKELIAYLKDADTAIVEH